MSETIMPAFMAFPNHAAIIGRILAGYGELEYLFASCFAATLGDRQSGIRAFFRIKGEDSRIQITSAIMRPKFDSVGMKDVYNETLGAMRWCKGTRNQYAHCHWAYDIEDGLYFTDFDKAVKTETGDIMLHVEHLDLEILKQQEAYFRYTLDLLRYLEPEYRKRVGELPSHRYEAPSVKTQPPRHSPEGTYTPPVISLNRRRPPQE